MIRFATFCLVLVFAALASAADRPNILYIMSDDHAAHAVSGGADGLQRLSRRLRSGSATTAHIHGTVTLPATADAERSWVAVWRGEDLVTMAPLDAQGDFEVELSPGHTPAAVSGTEHDSSRKSDAHG